MDSNSNIPANEYLKKAEKAYDILAALSAPVRPQSAPSIFANPGYREIACAFLATLLETEHLAGSNETRIIGLSREAENLEALAEGLSSPKKVH